MDKQNIEKELSDLDKKIGDTKDLDDFVNKLQALIDKEEEEIYSDIVRKEYRNPSNVGVIKDNNGFAGITSDCGDKMQFYLKIEDNIIKNVKFNASCGVTTATGSMLTKIIKGKRIEQVMKLTPQDLTDALNGLPPENLHCSDLAINTIKTAIKDHLKNHNSLGS